MPHTPVCVSYIPIRRQLPAIRLGAGAERDCQASVRNAAEELREALEEFAAFGLAAGSAAVADTSPSSSSVTGDSNEAGATAGLTSLIRIPFKRNWLPADFVVGTGAKAVELEATRRELLIATFASEFWVEAFDDPVTVKPLSFSTFRHVPNEELMARGAPVGVAELRGATF